MSFFVTLFPRLRGKYPPHGGGWGERQEPIKKMKHKNVTSSIAAPPSDHCVTTSPVNGGGEYNLPLSFEGESAASLPPQG